MAPARAFWKGYLKLSLVSCPIALYTGTSSTERVSFRQINKKTGNRLRQQLVDEVSREPVEGEDLDSPYYIMPDGQVGQDAFAVIREAMRGKDMVALGRVVLASASGSSYSSHGTRG